nr:hypothetical protein [Butyrivibrio sp.]
MGNNSIRKLLSVTMSMVMVCSLGTGCGKLLTRGGGVDPDSTSVSDATSKDSEANLSENKSIGSEEVPKADGTSDSSDNIPILLLHTDSDYAVNSKNNPAIHVNYNYLALDKEYAQSHEALDKALKSANEEILALESECFDQAKEDLSGSDDYTFDANYYTFFRRADGKYLSFINECCTFGTFDFDYYSFIAHSYYVESGKEIELSDIVADEDAFYAILSEKVKAVVDDDLYIYMGEYSNKDAEDFVEEIKDSLEDGKCSFTLDPQGVTFWFDSNVFSPMCASATVLFCEDADNTIFNEEFSKDIPDEWVMQMPTGDRTYFDANGDGEENIVIASVTYGFNTGGEYEYLYVSGFHLAYEEDSKSYSPEYEGSAGDYNFFLYHKGDKNLIIEDHDEFGYGEMSCYILEDGRIKDGDGINAGLAYSWDNAEDSEDIAPVFLPVNMNKVLVIEEVGGEEGESITCYLSVSEDGKLTLTEIDEDGDEDSEEADNKGGKSDDKEVDVAWAGEAVYYNDQILFRQYSSDAYRYNALWGKFSNSDMQYIKGNLCTFDPNAPENGIKTICEDDGFGDMYLIDGQYIYSQKETGYSNNSSDMRRVYKTSLPDGEQEEICAGAIEGFSPDGKHFTNYNYTLNPYTHNFYIFKAGDVDVDHASYQTEKTTIYLTMDNDNAYLMEKEDDDKYIILQINNEGDIYRLAECDFSDMAEYGTVYPEYTKKGYVDNGKLHLQFDFYEGTGHFYYASAKVTVPVCEDEASFDDVLYEAEIEDFSADEDPQTLLPDKLEDIAYDYPEQESGSAIANVLQYYKVFDEGIFYTMAQCHREPLEDVGWRESYMLLNCTYYFLPSVAKEASSLFTLFEAPGSRGDLYQYEYYERQPTVYAYARFYADEDGHLVGAFYETVYTGGPETPTETSDVYYMGEFSDDFKFEHPKDDYTIEDFVVEDAKALEDLIRSEYSKEDIIIDDGVFDENGHLVYESDRTFTNDEYVYMCHICFDAEGKINYIRPVIME